MASSFECTHDGIFSLHGIIMNNLFAKNSLPIPKSRYAKMLVSNVYLSFYQSPLADRSITSTANFIMRRPFQRHQEKGLDYGNNQTIYLKTIIRIFFLRSRIQPLKRIDKRPKINRPTDLALTFYAYPSSDYLLYHPNSHFHHFDPIL
jgi:hypothetical protein